MDKYTTILAIPEIDETTVNDARRLFMAYKNKKIISDCNFDNNVWNLNNETTGFHFNFELDSEKFQGFGKKLNITEDDFVKYLKTFIVCQLGEVDLPSIRSILYRIKRIAHTEIDNPETLLEVCNNNSIGRISDFFSMLPSKDREKELTDWLILFDEAEDYVQTRKTGEQRSLATFESYFRFDEIIKKFWKESKDENEKLFFFPIWMWWNISGILPLRPCEFVVTPRNCLNEINGKYTLTIRRNKKKGTGKTKSYKINEDFETNRYTIPENLAKEIQWYIDETKDYPEANTHTLFVTGTHYAMWERSTPYTSRFFSYINLSTCLRYFFNIIVKKRYGYRVIYNSDGLNLPDEKSIEYLHLGDTRHIALINLIAEGATPIVAMMLAGHDNPEMSAHYFSNITNLIQCKTYRQYKKQINGKQSYTLSNYSLNLPAKKSVQLDNNGRCFSKDVANGDYSNCYKVMGPAGEVGFCQNCEFYRDSSKAFSDRKEIYENKIKNECQVLEEIVKKVRSGKGEQEEITSVILRLRDSEYSYQQYLLEKMEVKSDG